MIKPNQKFEANYRQKILEEYLSHYRFKERRIAYSIFTTFLSTTIFILKSPTFTNYYCIFCGTEGGLRTMLFLNAQNQKHIKNI